MKATRIIARLDIKGPNLVKGVHLEGLRVLGDPKIFAKEYYQDSVDELIYMDTVASLYGRNSLIDFINYTAQFIFVPLIVGGGIRNLEDINKLLRAGADKVAINTAAIKNPQLIKEASKKYGSQCIVVSIEAKKISKDNYECFTDNGRERTGIDVFYWCKAAEYLGAGEILLTSVDREGTGQGYDVELTKKVSESVCIPVIASGGCGKLEHCKEVILEGKADAVSAASVFHYNKLESLINNLATKEYQEGNLNYVRSFYQGEVLGRKHITSLSIKEVKEYLKNINIFCRV
ncbi:MAG: imidazole glycerol phosphate synthase subunit HisF [Candidatus Omnitrophica bacterium]|jgi:cyclase|nr:imidazole glycerol phosphate synthase subunit HisF [Candidatus Omnitrophota bacterium]